MDEIEATASRAMSREGSLVRLVDYCARAYWPRWDRANVRRRILNQTNPHDERTPLQMRLWLEVLRDTGDDEMLEQAVDAHREGKHRAAQRETERLRIELERARRVIKARPAERWRETG